MPISITFTGKNRDDLLRQISDYMDPYRGAAIDVDRNMPEPVKASPRASFATPEAHEDPEDGLPPQDAEEFRQATEEEEAALSPKSLLELKAKMLSTLQRGIADGKIDQLRALLASHGGGAKSFPEVDPKLFADIEKAVKNGALA